MRLILAKSNFKSNIRELLRKCGYFGLSIESGPTSYVRRLSKTQYYPRFHLYLDEANDQITFNLHLDQKNVSYKGQTAHSGEYNDPLVKEEMERIKNIIA